MGEATGRMLADQGVRVVVADLNVVHGEKVASEIDGRFVPVDVSDPDQVIQAVEAAKDLGPLWSLVNCAGIGFAMRTVGRDGQYDSAHDLEIFRKLIDVNLVGTFNCIRLAATAMSQNEPDEEGQRGAIVNTGSIAAVEGQIGQVAYAASKGGIVGLTLPVARDLAVVGVRINTILPGLIDTPIYGKGEASDQFKERLGAGVLFPKRMGMPSEFARMVLELLTNDYMNGTSVRLDAGIRMPPK